MKGNTAEARKFITEMNRAYGISEITLMNYQATFKNMLSSLGGINQEVAYGLSETLSQMALDYASLYNTSIESAMTKFQAVLAGQVRPIRSESGYDITQATLYEVYKSIGGTKSVRQLSETEKRLLRILAVYRQMKDTAVGDYAKTITSTANQTRYMQETIKDIATWIGVGANQWLKQSNILIRINAYLIALKELAKSFAINMGYVEESEEKADDPLGDIEQGWDDINKQVDEYQGKLLGFDKFQVLSSADTGDGADISAELLKAMQEYEEILGKSQNIALFGDAEKNIKGAYDILKEWGYAYDEQSKQWLKDGKTVKENIEGIAKVLGSALFIVGLFVNKFLAIGAAVEFAYLNNENFRGSVNSFFKQISPYLNTIFSSASGIGDIILTIIPLLAESVLPILSTIISFASELTNYVKNIVNFGSPILLLLGDVLKILQPILEIITFIWEVPFKLFPAGAKIFSKPLQLILALLEAIAKVFQTITRLIADVATLNWGSIGKNFKQIWNKDNWNFAGKEVWDESIFDVENNTIQKPSVFYDTDIGKSLISSSSYNGTNVSSGNNMEDAVARGFVRGMAATNNVEGATDTNIYVDGQRLFNIMRNTAKRNGYDFVKV
jgi:predicted CoA-binding protein